MPEVGLVEVGSWVARYGRWEDGRRERCIYIYIQRDAVRRQDQVMERTWRHGVTIRGGVMEGLLRGDGWRSHLVSCRGKV